MSIKEVRAIVDGYRARVAARMGMDPSIFDGPYGAPFETRPAIMWVEPDRVPELLENPADGGAIVIEPADTQALAAAWPPLPETVKGMLIPAKARAELLKKWGPSPTRTVAVAIAAL